MTIFYILSFSESFNYRLIIFLDYSLLFILHKILQVFFLGSITSSITENYLSQCQIHPCFPLFQTHPIPSISQHFCATLSLRLAFYTYTLYYLSLPTALCVLVFISRSNFLSVLIFIKTYTLLMCTVHENFIILRKSELYDASNVFLNVILSVQVSTTYSMFDNAMGRWYKVIK